MASLNFSTAVTLKEHIFSDVGFVLKHWACDIPTSTAHLGMGYLYNADSFTEVVFRFHGVLMNKS